MIKMHNIYPWRNYNVKSNFLVKESIKSAPAPAGSATPKAAAPPARQAMPEQPAVADV